MEHLCTVEGARHYAKTHSMLIISTINDLKWCRIDVNIKIFLYNSCFQRKVNKKIMSSFSCFNFLQIASNKADRFLRHRSLTFLVAASIYFFQACYSTTASSILSQHWVQELEEHFIILQQWFVSVGNIMDSRRSALKSHLRF